MRVTKRTAEILKRMDEKYGTELFTYLEHHTPEQLLVATILSAQCTDARVNLVTKDLFVKYPDMAAFANASQEELEQDIRSTGFYHNKAKNIIACAKVMVEKYGGKVPETIEELTALPGVGRKTANVVLGNVFRKPSIVVDTHVGRIARRLQFTDYTDPVKVEFELMKKIPEDHWILINLQWIAFGREICSARKPDCENCFLTEFCREHDKKKDKTK
ncbi:MAG: endonuclease III [Eubacterium sp.]|nr:endonuclease III [Eubacterium sp.]